MRYNPSKTITGRALWGVFTAILLFMPLGVVLAEAPLNKDADNVAIEGYDTVAYFTEGQAVKGKPELEVVWHGARWFFSSANHRNLFAAAPERYAPQFGGLCAGAMRRGVVVKADPEAWTIVDGKLYMKVSKEARDEWREHPAENIREANEAWAEMVEKD